MTAPHTVDVAGTFPHYQFNFGGAAGRMHRKGHIWFNGDNSPISIRLKILTDGFVFCSNNSTDGSLALYISDDADPASKTQFNDYGVFSAPVLSGLVRGQGYKELTFQSANNDSKVYYYKLNLLELATNHIASLDPIIVNK